MTRAQTRLTIRIDLENGVSIGPGKIALLEAIDREGSIAAAARALAMSYARAWRLAAAVERDFARPVLSRGSGGSTGGGTSLTPFGQSLVRRYRRIEATAQAETQADAAALAAELAEDGGGARRPLTRP